MSERDTIMGYNKIVARAWSDPAFKERLLADPAATLRDEIGAEIEDGVTIRVLEPSETRTFFSISQTPPVEATDAVSELVRRAQSDPSLKAQLVAEPIATLTAAGIDVPDGMQVEVVGASDTEGYLLLPAKPEGLDLETIDDDVAGYFCAIIPLAALFAGGATAAAPAVAPTSFHTATPIVFWTPSTKPPTVHSVTNQAFNQGNNFGYGFSHR